MEVLNADKKLSRWNGVDFFGLVESFTEEEFAEMIDYLEFASNRYDDGFRYSYNKNYEYDTYRDIVYDYIRRRVFDNIGDDEWDTKPDWISILLATE